MGKGIQLLATLDKARTQFYHFKTIVIAGMGFFTDAYDLFCISTVSRLLGRLYYYDPRLGKPGSLPPNVSTAVNGAALFGTLLGQLFFGWLGDRWGRKKVYGITLVLMIFCSIGSGLSFGMTPKAVMSTMCIFRFWLGFGIGGDYPLSATIMSEYANTRTRGAFIAAVFAMQGIGILAGATVAIFLSYVFNKAYPSPSFEDSPLLSTPSEADFVWRIIFMLGAIPAALTYYWRMKMPETARYTALVVGNAKQATQDMREVLSVNLSLTDQDKVDRFVGSNKSSGLFSRKFAKKHGLQLLGTTSTWFLLDVAFYSQNLSQKDVFSAVGWIPPAKTLSGLEEMFRISRAQAILAVCSTIPGYWFTVLTIESLGRKFIQLMGFFMMTAFMFGLAIPYDTLRGEECATGLCGGQKITFLVLFGFTFFFANFGPNSTTFIIPAELFPARLRTTCHGISAAAGKAGAIVGAFGFQYAAQDHREGRQDHGYRTGIGTQKALILLACTNALGFFFTFLCPETKGRSLEDISGENEEIHADDECPDPPSITRSQNKSMPIFPI